MASDATDSLKDAVFVQNLEVRLDARDFGVMFGNSDSRKQAAMLLSMARSVRGYSWCQHCAYIIEHLDIHERLEVEHFMKTLLNHWSAAS